MEGRNREMTTWVAGWNMPGYLPESDPEGFDTWGEAHAYIVESVERAWDGGEDADYLDAHTELHAATPGEPYWVSVEGDRVRYWVMVGEG
jgi:hypothetical protein